MQNTPTPPWTGYGIYIYIYIYIHIYGKGKGTWALPEYLCFRAKGVRHHPSLVLFYAVGLMDLGVRLGFRI